MPSIYVLLVTVVYSGSDVEAWSDLKFVPAKNWAQAIAAAQQEILNDFGASDQKFQFRFERMNALSKDNLQALIDRLQVES